MITNMKIKRAVVCLLCIGILSLSICLLVSPKKEFSENENRYLTKFPSFSAKALLDGDYTDSLGNWLADHFPQRDFFVGLKSGVEIAGGRKEINNVYIAQDDYLIEAYAKPQNTARITDTFARFYEKIDTAHIDVHLMLVPTAVTIYNDKLPTYAPDKKMPSHSNQSTLLSDQAASLSVQMALLSDQTASQSDQMTSLTNRISSQSDQTIQLSNQLTTASAIYDASGIPAVDCTDWLFDGASEGQIYYLTDHHWTTLGAYYGYLAYCDAKKMTPVSLDTLTKETVTEEFAGTLYSKVNDYSHPKDAITIYTNPADDLTVTYADTGEVTHSLYNLDYVNEKDKYSLFLNNIHPLVEIENSTAATQDELLLIKDSYANSMVPFLAHHYSKIYVLDTRYYRDGPSAFLAEHKDITDVLLLYNMNTLDNDTGIRGIF